MPVIDQYEIIESLGEGSAGRVFKAKQTLSDRTVAIKVLSAEFSDERGLQRFQREAQITSSLNHSNIVSIYSFGLSAEKQPYFVMEYLNGITLSEIIQKNGKLPLKNFLILFEQICSALDYAHNKGVLHRDLKPANIMVLTDELGNETAKLLDFGVAMLLEQTDSKAITKTGELIGTPTYMSPEQCSGKRPDNRSDIYSLGCIMFECLTGRPPFVAQTSQAVLLMQLNEEPAAISSISPQLRLPPLLFGLIYSCLAKVPEERPQSALAVSEQLSKAGREQTIEARYLSASGGKSAHLQIRKVVFIGLLCVSALLLFFLPAKFPTNNKTAQNIQSKHANKLEAEKVNWSKFRKAFDIALGEKQNANLPKAIELFEQVIEQLRLVPESDSETSRTKQRLLYLTYKELALSKRASGYGDSKAITYDWRQSEKYARAGYGEDSEELADIELLAASDLFSAALCMDSMRIYKKRLAPLIDDPARGFSEPRKRSFYVSRILGNSRLLGMIYGAEGKFQEAKEKLEESLNGYLDLYQSDDDPDVLWTKAHLWRLFYLNKHFAQAELLEKELVSSVKNSSTFPVHGKWELLNLLITTYLGNRDLNKAKNLTLQLVEILKQNQHCPRELARAYCQSGEIYSLLKENGLAQKFADKSRDMLENTKAPSLDYNWRHLSKLYLKLGDKDKSAYCQKMEP